MRYIILTTIISAIPFILFAQKKDVDNFKVSIGVDAGFPVGNLQAGHKIGIGGSLQANYTISEITHVTLYGGYITFDGKTTTTIGAGGQTISFKQPSKSIIPVLGGFKFSFAKNFYTHPQLGMSFFTSGRSAATFALGLGVQTGKKIDLSIRYQSTLESNSGSNFYGVRAAFIF